MIIDWHDFWKPQNAFEVPAVIKSFQGFKGLPWVNILRSTNSPSAPQTLRYCWWFRNPVDSPGGDEPLHQPSRIRVLQPPGTFVPQCPVETVSWKWRQWAAWRSFGGLARNALSHFPENIPGSSAIVCKISAEVRPPKNPTKRQEFYISRRSRYRCFVISLEILSVLLFVFWSS